jgi:hypothetical protein
LHERSAQRTILSSSKTKKEVAMRKFKALTGILIILLMVLLLSSSISAAGPEAQWVKFFYYDLRGGWAEGPHTYQFDVTWTEPSPGSTVSQGEFTVSADAPVYAGRVLLRSFYELAIVTGGCEQIDVIHPDQLTRFHIGWLTDEPMTRKEAQAHFESMTVTATADGGPSVELRPYGLYRWTEVTENAMDRVICHWTMKR